MVFNFISEDGTSGAEDICRCLNNILNIPEGSIPLARGLGINWRNLSQIPPDLENDIATEIIEKIEEYEPRVSVNEVTFTYGDEGVAIVNILLVKGEERSEI